MVSTRKYSIKLLENWHKKVPLVYIGFAALGGHFAKLCKELDYYEAFFFITNFKKEKIIYGEKYSMSKHFDLLW